MRKKDAVEIYIDDTLMDLSNEPEMTDEEYEQFRVETRKYVEEKRNKK